jgi:integrase
MHEARHTAITEFLRRSGNLKFAQMLAGHADIGTTANVLRPPRHDRSRDRAPGARRGLNRDGTPESFRPKTRILRG